MKKSYFSNDDFDFPIFGGLNCLSKNIIYIIECKACGDKYVGETGRCLTHLGLVSHICVPKNSSHFPSDAYMRHKSLYFSYRPRGRPIKQCQAKMS